MGADGAVSHADLVRAARDGRARGFVEALPRGLGELLSERGANISHGQRQLLAIARALVYNPAVLVLDEATSSVDPESEALIQAAMSRLLAGRTSITIAHRLSTVHAADRILVLHHGRIHEEGTHEDLVRRGGLYARLYELQFGRRRRRERFAHAVLDLVRRIPRGRVATYGQIAALVGRPRSARAVGQALRGAADGVPWHRVVNAQGSISRRSPDGGMMTQRIRLEQEGVVFRGGRVVLARFRWQGAAGRRPRGFAVQGSGESTSSITTVCSEATDETRR